MDEKADNAKDPARRLRWRDVIFFARFAGPVRGIGAVAFALSIAVPALGALLPLGAKVFVDYIALGQGLDKLGPQLVSVGMGWLAPLALKTLGSPALAALAFVVLGTVMGALGLWQRLLGIRFQQEVTLGVQTALFERMLRFPIAFFRGRQSGYLASRVSDDVGALQYLFSDSLPQAIAKAAYLTFGLMIMYAINTTLALVVTATLPLYALINYYFSGRLKAISYKQQEAGAQATADLQEAISGAELIKSSVAEGREAQKVSFRIRHATEQRSRGAVVSALSRHSMRGTQMLSALLVMWLGAYQVQGGMMSTGDFVAFIAYTIYLTGAANTLFMFNVLLQPVLVSLERLMALFDILPETGHVKSGKPVSGQRIKGAVEFKDVCFSYEGGPVVLRDVTFSVSPGEAVLVAGPSGAGKTTLINLLLKFYKPVSGTIKIDGKKLEGMDAQWLRRQVAVVSQDVFLFNDTIAGNIRYAAPTASRDEVVDAAKQARIHDEITQMPEGYATVVGERGVRLSAGQRQRISVARAFLGDPVLLILDEPASALDTATEKLLAESIEELARGRTTFIISHKSSVARFAGITLTLKDGRVYQAPAPPADSKPA